MTSKQWTEFCEKFAKTETGSPEWAALVNLAVLAMAKDKVRQTADAESLEAVGRT
jgi:hypothetical protein